MSLLALRDVVDTSPIPPSLEPLIAVQHAVAQTSHFLAAGVAIFFYDYALTFGEELHYMWSSSFSIVKALFLFNRYATPLLLIGISVGVAGFTTTSVKGCQVIIFGGGVAMVCLFSAWNWLIAIRVHALYELVPRIKWFLGIYWVVTAVITMGLTIHQMMIISRHAIVIEDLKACTPGLSLPKDYWVIWLPSICYETTMFVMTMVKLRRVQSFSATGLRRLLIRDGFIYYAAITSVRVANIVMFIRGDPTTVYEALFIFIGFGSSLVSRMVLNLRSWSDSSTQFGDDPGWRVGATGNMTGEMHGMTDIATYRSRRHVTSNGHDGVDVSVHIDAPVYGTRPHYRNPSMRGRANHRMNPAHHIVIETETVVIAEDDRFDLKETPTPSDSKDNLSDLEDAPRSVWFAHPYQNQKPQHSKNETGDVPDPR